MRRSLFLVLPVLVALLIAPAVPAQIPFDPPTAAIGSGSWSRVVAADLDRDGDLDLVAVSSTDNTLVLVESAGDGLYVTARPLTSHPDLFAPSDVRIADLDRDGDDDIVVSLRSGDRLLWFEQLAPLDFGDPSSNGRIIASPNAPAAIAIVDLDRDGDLDVAVVSNGPSLVVWYENDGNPASTPGDWATTTIFSGSTATFTDIASGDLDADGDDDLVTASLDEISVAWYENLIDGDFGTATTSRQSVSIGATGARAVDIADLDRDGDLDIAAASTDASQIAIYENWTIGGPAGGVENDGPESAGGGGDGPIDFGPGQRGRPDAAQGIPWDEQTIDLTPAAAISAVDLDLDGDPDLLVAPIGGPPIWFENDEGFEPPIALPSTASGSVLALAFDADSDGDPDVLAAPADGGLELFENRAIHRNALFNDERFIDSANVGAIVVDRLGADGALDLFAAGFDESLLQYDGRDDGSGFDGPSYSIETDGVTELATCDLDRDGDTDVVAANTNGRVSWLENEFGAGPSTLLEISGSPGASYSAIALADLDRDGDTDVLSGLDSFGGGINLQWWENDGTPGAFDDWARTDIAELAIEISGIAPADVDRDGDLDVIVGARELGCGEHGELNWFSNDGSGGLGSAIPIELDPSLGVNDVAAADLDGDGAIDAIAGWNGRLGWYAGGGDGTFAPFESIDDDVRPRSLHTGDADLDGDVDLLIVTTGDGRLLWYQNLGEGSFAAAEQLWEGDAGFYGAARDARLAAISRGVAPDIVFSADDLRWLPNRGGQLTVEGGPIAPEIAYETELTPLLELHLELHARTGDPVGLLRAVDVRFGVPVCGECSDDPLTTAQALGLFETLRLYRDVGAPGFDAAEDVLVSSEVPNLDEIPPGLSVQRLALDVDDPNARIAAPATFLVVAEMGDAADFDVDSFVASLIVDGGSVVQAETTIELSRTGLPQDPVRTGEIDVAALIVVDSTADEVDEFDEDDEADDGICLTVSGTCTLRAAVQTANGSGGKSKIVVPAGTYTLTIPGRGENANQTGDLDVSGNLLIVGAGSSETIVDAAGLDRIFDVDGDSRLELRGMTLSGGDPSSPFDDPESCGAIRVRDSSLELFEMALTGNTAAGGGGALCARTSSVGIDRSLIAGNSSGAGPALLIDDDSGIDLVNSTVADNIGGGLGVFGDFSFGGVDSSTIVGNSGVGLEAFLYYASLTIGNTLVADNGTDVSGEFDSRGANLIGDLGGGAGGFSSFLRDQVGGDDGPTIDARLGELGDHGGPTMTVPIFNDSPALDSGSCPGLDDDQRGLPRRLNLTDVTVEEFDVDDEGPSVPIDACDIGAYELGFGQTVEQVEVPMRWCGVAGAPSIDSPPEGMTADDVMRRRHELPSDEIYGPQANLFFRSGATIPIPNYPIIADPNTDVGNPGDVVIVPELGEFTEFEQLTNACRAAWQALDPKVTGITAVSINRFVDGDGLPIDLLGLGGRAEPGSVLQQMAAGRVMVIDPVWRVPPFTNPADSIDRLTGHELGHAISWRHGNGVDDDGNGVLDDDDDGASGLPALDGPNLMQYRDGVELSVAQMLQARTHIALTIPDAQTEPTVDSFTDDESIPSDVEQYLEDEFTSVLESDPSILTGFGFQNLLDFGFQNLLDFGFQNLLDFQFADISEVGAEVDPAGSQVTLFAATDGLLWPTPLQPDTTYQFYLNLDEATTTGGLPSDFGFPAGNPPEQGGIDLIARVEVGAACPGAECTVDALLTLFEYNELNGGFFELTSTAIEVPSSIPVGLLQNDENASLENRAIGTLVKAPIPLAVLTARGFTPGAPIGLEVLSTLECPLVLPTGEVIDCGCDSCAVCPNNQGCIESGVPSNVIVPDRTNGRLTFEPPLLPECTVQPGATGPGAVVTVFGNAFPLGIGTTVDVSLNDTVLATTPVSSIGADNAVQIQLTLPAVPLGTVVRLSMGITGTGIRDQCDVRTCADGDLDGVCDVEDSLPDDSTSCSDIDDDGCDDCSGGTFDLASDGPDFDGDGLCDTGDADADGDGVETLQDPNDFDPTICGDADDDGCDDCGGDGVDDDGDGVCDAIDNCLDLFNPAQLDDDADGLGCLCDNCPDVANADQSDADGDGLGDVCDQSWFSVARTGYVAGAGTLLRNGIFRLAPQSSTPETLATLFSVLTNVDALDVDLDGTIRFSIRPGGVYADGAGIGTFGEATVYTWDGALAAVDPAWAALGLELPTLNAIDELGDGRFAFSTDSAAYLVTGGGLLTLQPWQVWVAEAAATAGGPPSLSLLFDTNTALGTTGDVDAVDRLADGRIAFSLSSSKFVIVDGSLVRLAEQSAFIYDPADGSLVDAVAGLQLGLPGLNALTLRRGEFDCAP